MDRTHDAIALILTCYEGPGYAKRFVELVRPYGLNEDQLELVIALAGVAAQQIPREEIEAAARGGVLSRAT
jgi:hypothetical protein